jgi:dephospho-CoA kinase
MLVAFAGFGGAGKTTAIQFLEGRHLGQRVYLGEAVSDEIERLGVVRTPEVEHAVRIDLRSRLGPSAFADLRAPNIVQLIGDGKCVLVDAIFKLEEYSRLLNCGQDRSILVSVEASFETRSRRLEARSKRGYSAKQLRDRDRTEMEDLGTSGVLKVADFTISNEQTLEDFYDEVAAFWKRLSV